MQVRGGNASARPRPAPRPADGAGPAGRRCPPVQSPCRDDWQVGARLTPGGRQVGPLAAPLGDDLVDVI